MQMIFPRVFPIRVGRGLPYQAPHIRPQHTVRDPDLPYQTPTYHIRPRSYRSGLTVLCVEFNFMLTVVLSNTVIFQ